MQGAGEAAVADLGGSIITGIHSNPLAVLARQLDIPLHDISSHDVPLFLQDGSELDAKVDKEVRYGLNPSTCCSVARIRSNPYAAVQCLWFSAGRQSCPFVMQPSAGVVDLLCWGIVVLCVVVLLC